MGWSEPWAGNRSYWDSWSDEYQREHGPTLRGAAWGGWQIPEDELAVLGEVAGKDVLELGCGAAQWSTALAQRGARCTGLDNSERQLEHARAAGADFPLVHAAAEAVPLPDASFDIILSDHGAFSWGDPNRVTPEAARLLRAGGLLAFNVASPFARLCYDEAADREFDRLLRSYFELRTNDENGQGTTFDLPYGEWIRLLRRSGFVVEDLIELRPPPGAVTSYGADIDWSRRWPGENIWVARKL